MRQIDQNPFSITRVEEAFFNNLACSRRSDSGEQVKSYVASAKRNTREKNEGSSLVNFSPVPNYFFALSPPSECLEQATNNLKILLSSIDWNNKSTSPVLVRLEWLLMSLTICLSWFLLNNKIHYEWTRLKAIMSMVSDETEIKVLFYFSITGIFIITSTKRMDKLMFPSERLFCSQFISVFNKSIQQYFINPFERFSHTFEIYLIHPFCNFIHPLKRMILIFWTVCKSVQNLLDKRLVKPFKLFLDRLLHVLFSHSNSFLLVTVLPLAMKLFYFAETSMQFGRLDSK